MLMQKSSKQNEFYIDLEEERYFYQGERISGDVVIDLQKETRTSHIKIVLIGTVTINDKPFVVYNDERLLARNPNGGDRTHILQAHTHRFHFSFTIPSSKPIPSTLNIPNTVSVKYRLVATHRIVSFRVIGWDKLSPTIYKPVNILEHIDVESSEFGGTYSQTRDVTIAGEHKKSNIIVKLPKRAAVRGDTIQINVDIDHVSTLVREKGVVAKLVQYVYSRKSKSQLHEPTTLSADDKNIVISNPVDFSTSMNLSLHIPRNISPTVEGSSGHIFRVEYVIEVQVNLNNQDPKSPGRGTGIITFDVPFTIGTYPKLSQCIEEDDEEEEVGEEEEEIDLGSESTVSYTDTDQLSDTISSLSVSSNNVTPEKDDPKQQHFDLPISLEDAPNIHRHHSIKPDEVSSTQKTDHKYENSQLPMQIQSNENDQFYRESTSSSNLQPELPIQITSEPSPQIPFQLSPYPDSEYIVPSRNSTITSIPMNRRSTQMSSASTTPYPPMKHSYSELSPTQLPIMISSPTIPERHKSARLYTPKVNNPPIRINTVISRTDSIKPALSPIKPEDMSPTRPISHIYNQPEAMRWVTQSTDRFHSPVAPPPLHSSFSDNTNGYPQNNYQRSNHPYNMQNHNFTNITSMPTPVIPNNPYPTNPPSSMPSLNDYPVSPHSPMPSNSNYPLNSQYSGWSNSNYPANPQSPVHMYMPQPNTSYGGIPQPSNI